MGGHGWRKPGEPTVDQKDTVVFDPAATTNPIAIYVKATDVIEVYAPNHHYTLDANLAVGDPAGLILRYLTNPTPSPTTHTELRASLIARHTDAAAAKGGWVWLIQWHSMVNVSLSVLSRCNC